MEITPELIYWITRLDGLKKFFDGFGFVVFAIGFILSVLGIGNVLAENKSKKWLLSLLIPLIGAFFIFVSTFIPTTKEMAAIYIIPSVANNESVQAIPNSILNLANEWMEELRPNKKEGD